jgi:hypothetical protein
MSISSINCVAIRLPDERWRHITEEHTELAGMRDQVLDTVANPLRIFAGRAGELLATKEIGSAIWLVVVYRESRSDGFIITAFVTSRLAPLKGENKYGGKRRTRIFQLVPVVKETPEHNVWLSYDDEADTYVNFKSRAAQVIARSPMMMIVRYDGKEIVGYTILHASKR